MMTVHLVIKRLCELYSAALGSLEDNHSRPIFDTGSRSPWALYFQAMLVMFHGLVDATTWSASWLQWALPFALLPCLRYCPPTMNSGIVILVATAALRSSILMLTVELQRLKSYDLDRWPVLEHGWIIITLHLDHGRHNSIQWISSPFCSRMDSSTLPPSWYTVKFRVQVWFCTETSGSGLHRPHGDIHLYCAGKNTKARAFALCLWSLTTVLRNDFFLSLLILGSMVQSAFAIQLDPPAFRVRFWANIGQRLSHIVSITTTDNSISLWALFRLEKVDYGNLFLNYWYWRPLVGDTDGIRWLLKIKSSTHVKESNGGNISLHPQQCLIVHPSLGSNLNTKLIQEISSS